MVRMKATPMGKGPRIRTKAPSREVASATRAVRASDAAAIVPATSLDFFGPAALEHLDEGNYILRLLFGLQRSLKRALQWECTDPDLLCDLEFKAWFDYATTHRVGCLPSRPATPDGLWSTRMLVAFLFQTVESTYASSEGYATSHGRQLDIAASIKSLVQQIRADPSMPKEFIGPKFDVGGTTKAVFMDTQDAWELSGSMRFPLPPCGLTGDKDTDEDYAAVVKTLHVMGTALGRLLNNLCRNPDVSMEDQSLSYKIMVADCMLDADGPIACKRVSWKGEEEEA